MRTSLTRERIACLALATVEGMNRRRFEALLEAFGSGVEVLEAPVTALVAVSGVRVSLAERILRRREALSQVAARAAALKQKRIDFRFSQEEGYPPQLRRFVDAPPVLFFRGRQPFPWSSPTVAIVGTRRPSSAGERGSQYVAEVAALEGWIVVSGLARGIDSLAHRTALERSPEDFRTLAVLGSALDVIYPPEHRPLAAQIAQAGGLLSEQFYGTVQPYRLVRRNRLISGLSWGVLIVEADTGSTHTARYAQSQRLPVAVWGEFPGRDLPEGNRRLVEELGASVVIETNLREWLHGLWDHTQEGPSPGLLFQEEESNGFSKQLLGTKTKKNSSCSRKEKVVCSWPNSPSVDRKRSLDRLV